MRVLGVDPGTWRTGAGILEADGSRFRLVYEELIAVPKKLEISARLAVIYRRLADIIQTYRPEVLALENLFYGIDARATIRIGEARACAMLAAAQAGMDVAEYLPTRVKQSVTGHGRAGKSQVQQMMKSLLGLPKVLPADVADALAVAVCHVHMSKPLKEASAGPGAAWPKRVIRRIVKG